MSRTPRIRCVPETSIRAEYIARPDDKLAWNLLDLHADLQQAPPFLHCDDTQVWGVTPYKQERCTCRQKGRLVAALVHALQTYFDTRSLAQVGPSPAELQETWTRAVWHVVECLRSYEALRTSRRLSSQARASIPSVSRASLLKYERFLVELSSGFTPEDYAAIAHILTPSYAQAQLETAMWSAFDDYGPVIDRRTFSDTARYYALAEILRHFGIEHRKVETVVARLRKTVQRRTPRRH